MPAPYLLSFLASSQYIVDLAVGNSVIVVKIPLSWLFSSMRIQNSVIVVKVPLPWLFSSLRIQISASRLVASSIVTVCLEEAIARLLWNVCARDAAMIDRP